MVSRAPSRLLRTVLMTSVRFCSLSSRRRNSRSTILSRAFSSFAERICCIVSHGKLKFAAFWRSRFAGSEPLSKKTSSAKRAAARVPDNLLLLMAISSSRKLVIHSAESPWLELVLSILERRSLIVRTRFLLAGLSSGSGRSKCLNHADSNFFAFDSSCEISP